MFFVKSKFLLLKFNVKINYINININIYIYILKKLSN